MTAINFGYASPPPTLTREHLVYPSASVSYPAIPEIPGTTNDIYVRSTATPKLLAYSHLTARKKRYYFRHTMLDAFRRAMTAKTGSGAATVTDTTITSSYGMVNLNAVHSQYATTAAGALKAVLDLYHRPWRRGIGGTGSANVSYTTVAGRVYDILDLVRIQMEAKLYSANGSVHIKDWWAQGITVSATAMTPYSWLYNNTSNSLLGTGASPGAGHYMSTYTGGLLDMIAFYTYYTD
jgi:hypothetical protein